MICRSSPSIWMKRRAWCGWVNPLPASLPCGFMHSGITGSLRSWEADLWSHFCYTDAFGKIPLHPHSSTPLQINELKHTAPCLSACHAQVDLSSGALAFPCSDVLCRNCLQKWQISGIVGVADSTGRNGESKQARSHEWGRKRSGTELHD